MKTKIFLSFLIISIALTLLCGAESEWLFDSIDKLEKWTSNSQMLQYEIKNGKCEFSVMGDTPYISYISSEKIDFSKFKIAAFSINSDTEGYVLKIEAITVSGDKYNASTELYGDGEWHDYIVDFPSIGDVSTINVYFLSDNYADNTARFVFERIGFFESVEKAEYFLERSLVSLKEKDELLYPSGNGPFKWDFSETSSINSWNISADFSHEVGMLSLKPIDANIAISYTFSPQSFNSREYPYFAMRYKSEASNDVSRIDFNTNKSGDGSGHFVIKNDGTWHNLIIDMSKYANRKWNGYVNNVTLRIPSGEFSTEDSVCIERIGFFENYNDASQYLVENADNGDYKKKRIFKGAGYKIIVPSDTMTESYEEKDISVDSSGEYRSSDVVMYNGVPLPLSDISDRGYMVYCAKGKGTYTVGRYEKAYSDTKGHWAEEYINYVSARTLFSGTSPDKFSPDMTITAGMFVTVLGRMHGVDAEKIGSDSGYADVRSDEYYAPYIKWVKDSGIFKREGNEFSPEKPITRGEMALIIANYAELCGFEMLSYETSNVFSDVLGCPDDIKKAVSEIQSIGIINGKSETVFDPYGSLTRAEASAVMTRLVKSILGVYYVGDTFDNDKIRIGLYANFDVDLLNETLLYAYRSAGFDSMFISNEIAYSDKRDFTLGYCDRHGIQTIMPLDNTFDPEGATAEYFGHNSFDGNFVYDEPGVYALNEVSGFSEHYKESMNGKKFIVNLLPLYSSAQQLEYGKLASYPDYYDADPVLYRDYCEKYAQNVASDVLMTNVFPFVGDNIYDKYIEAVSIPADVAHKNGKEFWCMIQADGIHNTKEHFLRQYYTLLSFGCKNIVLWLWNDGLCDDYGEFTSSYHSAKEANLRIKNITEVLEDYTYLYTAVLNSDYNDELYGISNLKNADISIEGTDSPIVIGVFDLNGKKAYTVFNTSNNEPAKVTFSSKDISETVTVYSENGEPETIKSGSEVTVSLKQGDGVLLVL